MRVFLLQFLPKFFGEFLLVFVRAVGEAINDFICFYFSMLVFIIDLAPGTMFIFHDKICRYSFY